MKFRHAVRALLVSPELQILLMKLQLKNPDHAFWIAPGGGVEQGEDLHDALRREIFEETGNGGVRIGPLVWHRQHEFEIDGESVHQFEEFFLCRTEEFDAVPKELNGPLERDCFRELRWWPLDEIGQSPEVFVPRTLFADLTTLMKGNLDDYPVDVGI